MNAHQERQNIHDLLVRYCTGIDTRDWELFRGVFTPTCRLDYGPIGQWESAEAITAYMEATQMQFGHAMHRITNVAVTLQDSVPDHPERATARTYVDVLLMSGDNTSGITASGIYEDVLVHTHDGWRIHERDFTLVLMGSVKNRA